MAGFLCLCPSKLRGEAGNIIIENQPSLYEHKNAKDLFGRKIVAENN
ncbi:hypothetical protein GAMM_90003 [Gammaproteobacteria bacterium]|jgi:hypothetical protein